MGFGKDGKGVILRESQTITLGTLASSTAIKAASNLAVTEDFRIIKSEILVSFRAMQPDESPIILGLADNELSVAEIGECLLVDGPVDRNDRQKEEEATRPVWEICQNTPQVFAGPSDNAPNNGLPIEKTFRWTFSNDEGWCWFAWNASGAALDGGGSIVIHAKHFGVWVS